MMSAGGAAILTKPFFRLVPVPRGFPFPLSSVARLVPLAY